MKTLSQIQREALEQLNINVVSIVQEATILHCGWDMDNYMWLSKTKTGVLEILSTNHGGICKMNKMELQEIIKETKNSLSQLKDILYIMNLPKDSQ